LNQLEALYKKYSRETWFWIQEEPLNMGAASFLADEPEEYYYGFISRQRQVRLTATGYAKVHAQEQARNYWYGF